MPRLWKIRIRIITTILTTSFLAGFIAFLILKNYWGQLALQESKYHDIHQNLEKRAIAVGYFYDERKRDLKNLAASRVLAIYFENQALGMSMAYGLKASLVNLNKIVDELRVGTKLGGEAVFSQIVFLDNYGNYLVDSRSPTFTGNIIRPNPKLVKLNHHNLEPELLVDTTGGEHQVVVSCPYFFKGTYQGQFLAFITRNLVLKNLIHDGLYVTRIKFNLYFIDENICKNLESYNFTDRDAMENFANLKLDEPLLDLKADVPETPFFLGAFLPAANVMGGMAPGQLLLALGFFALLIVGGTVLVWRANTRNEILGVRLEESIRRERVIEEKNQQAEELVQQRTQELQEAHKEMVAQAMEAGRGQLAAMVLHNIGNAVTPMGIYLEEIQSPEGRQALEYLSKSYQELGEHRPNLEEFVNNDPRGQKVFDFMGRMILALDQRESQRQEIITKTKTAIEYISQILTLQQIYFTNADELKEEVDINLLIENALFMQTGPLEKRQINIVKQLMPNLPTLIIDKSKLIQVIINLLKNSYEAIEAALEEQAERLITIFTGMEDEFIKIGITDNGIGFEANMQSKLFEFGRSSKSSSGIGLYYCQQFLDNNGGSIEIVSEGKGKGATVLLKLPQLAEKGIIDGRK